MAGRDVADELSAEPDLYGTNWNFVPVIFWK